MKIKDLVNPPYWLLLASVVNEDVDIEDHRVVWRNGEWQGGEWQDGVWRDGVWRGDENRLLYHASFCGIHFEDRADSQAVAYRTTRADGTGRYTDTWTQVAGDYRDASAAPAGSGTCVPGIHVTSAARAWTYFGIEPTCQFWRVRFRREDLLDCDGEKARIRGGTFERILRPF